MYPWQRRFYESRNRYVTLVASNQSGKSAIQIRKCINWATNKALWPELWEKTPIQFWYLYPDGSTATREFYEKWVREFLPSGIMKDHPVYGWYDRKRKGDIDFVRFNSGVTVYFKTYSQNVHNLQAGSVHAIFGDEEIPWELMAELQMRVVAFDGYMNFAFTATRGQEEWRRIVEERGKDEMWKEGEVDILKLQVTAYECLTYEDGTPSTVWSHEKIEETKRSLATEQQIKRRIYGRFVKDDGLKYPSFSRKKHITDEVTIDFTHGHVYAGVDYGSGTNHQSAIAFCWVSKDHTYGIIFDLWLGERGIPTDAGSVVKRYKEMVAHHGCAVTRVFYDWSCADLKTIANSSGLFFEHADKSHATGERILNTLFESNMLKIMKVGAWEQLSTQLETLTLDEIKRYANDDICDALRYALTKIPWNYTDLNDKPTPVPISQKKNTRHEHLIRPADSEESIEDEILEWAEYLGNDSDWDY
jgi:hypothetical protein